MKLQDRILIPEPTDNLGNRGLRVCTEQEIHNMSAGSFALYKRRVIQFSDRRANLTSETIRALDFLQSAVRRSVEFRNRKS